jgi:hypothetical protein
MEGAHTTRTCAQLANLCRAIMRQRMRRNLHSRTGYSVKGQKKVMYGSRDPRPRVWRVDLKKKFETKNVQCNHAYDNSTHAYLINYLYATCFSPVKSTWITAIANGHFTSWPGLT